ncbi:hypothetical protein KVP70_22360 [Duganella sp. HSC-15S17]|uniref:Uncharacterized protein n=2 Tax=Duganella violaceipulchra TaxID=2849652 RepID=A0AA41HAB2_9BURK|nr:hypothetical protein [Duganella violaceicalia]MCP2009039.1 hypothetical protein [Duganella violaceicalia]
MQVADQAIRIEVGTITKAQREEPDAGKRFRLDAEFKVLAERMRGIDVANQQAVAEILASGWPTRATIGQTGMSDLFLIIQHADLDFQKLHIEGVRQAALRGDIRKSNVATLEDRLLVRQGRPQLYGTQIKGSSKLTPYPIDSAENLDKRRSEMGLEPMCAYLANFATMFGPVEYAPCTGK